MHQPYTTYSSNERTSKRLGRSQIWVRSESLARPTVVQRLRLLQTASSAKEPRQRREPRRIRSENARPATSVTAPG